MESCFATAAVSSARMWTHHRTDAIIHERLGGVAIAPFLPDTDVKKSVGGAQVDIWPRTSRRRTTRKNKSSTGTKPQSILWSSKSTNRREDRLKPPSRRCLLLMRDVSEVHCLPRAASVPFADTDASEVAMDAKDGGDGEQKVDSTATAADGAGVMTLPEECFRKESTAGACQASPLSLTGSSSPRGAASAVLVKNGIKLECTFASAADLLRSLPNHAYTTTRTAKEGTLLMCWDRHMLRLFDSRNRLHLNQCTGSALSSTCSNVAADDEKNAKEEEEEEENEKEEEEDFACFKSKVEASVHVAMEEALLTKREGEGEELNVVILAGIGEKKGDVYVYVAPLRLLKEDAAALPPPVEVAVLGPARTLPDAKYTDWVKIRRSLEQNKPASVSEVILSNDGRTLLEGMVTNFFVIKRRRQRSENSQEVSILIRDDDDGNAGDEKHGNGGNNHDSDIGGSGEKTGRPSSSFPPTTTSSSSYSGSPSVTTEPSGVSITDIELQTATLVEGVLPGVIRSLILDICAERGISVRETAPSLDDRAEWMGGFLTNSLHPLRPISAIYLTSECTWSTAMDSWSSAAATLSSSSSSSSLASWRRYELSTAHANFTEAIAKLVWERALQESIHVKALLSS